MVEYVLAMLMFDHIVNKFDKSTCYKMQQPLHLEKSNKLQF